MSNTSKKQRDFVSEPMGEKNVTALPGVGPVLGTRLEAAGFNKVFFLIYKYFSFYKTHLCDCRTHLYRRHLKKKL